MERYKAWVIAFSLFFFVSIFLACLGRCCYGGSGGCDSGGGGGGGGGYLAYV